MWICRRTVVTGVTLVAERACLKHRQTYAELANASCMPVSSGVSHKVMRYAGVGVRSARFRRGYFVAQINRLRIVSNNGFAAMPRKGAESQQILGVG